MTKKSEIRKAADRLPFPESARVTAAHVLSVEATMEIARAILWPEADDEQHENLQTARVTRTAKNSEAA